MNSLFQRVTEFFTGGGTAASFRKWMDAVGNALGLEVVWGDDSGACAFIVPHRGETYTVVAAQTSGGLHLSVSSNIKFPRGELPQVVVEYLAGKNREFEGHCHFDTIDTRRQSYFVLRTLVKWGNAHLGFLRTFIQGAVNEMHCVDVAMIKAGCA